MWQRVICRIVDVHGYNKIKRPMAPVFLARDGYVGRLGVEMMCYDAGEKVSMALDALVEVLLLLKIAQRMENIAGF